MIVAYAGRDAVDADALKDERRCRGRRSRVVLTPRRRRQVSRRYSRGDGDKQARSPGRARSSLLKPLRAGMPGDSGDLAVTMLVWFIFFPTRGCGCNGHPAFPTPSIFGAKDSCTTRAHRAAGMRICIVTSLRGAKRRSNPFHYAALWIASLRSQ
jgi:hypothetical protein